jgi:probable HAF family extracellular repeat protein
MKSTTWTCIITLTLLAALAIPAQLAAQDNAKRDHHHQYHHYQIVDPGTFGGPQSFGSQTGARAGILNNRGTLTGAADTLTVDPYCLDITDCYAAHAFQLQNGVTTDLGVLAGGVGSQVNWISANGLMAGLGDNGQPDPLSGGALPQQHAVLWEHRHMTDLGTLPEGGYLSFPYAVNNRGEVVGFANNTIPDPNSMNSGYGYQTRAFYWKNGVMQDIGTLGTGTDAQAALINERGQVVGMSYTNSVPSAICAGDFGFSLTTSSFIWDPKNGMRDIGGLGGTCTLALDFNNRGQVVGASAVTGDLAVHPFVWDAETGVTDLLRSSEYGFADGENDRGEVVGGTCDPQTCHALLWRKTGAKWEKTTLGTIAGFGFAGLINNSGQVIGAWGNGPFLWEDGGPMVDMNTLVPPNSGIQLVEAQQINDRGEIAVQGTDVSGNQHAVLLIPCDENHSGVEGCDYSMVDAATAAQRAERPYVPRAPQRLTQSRRSKGYHFPGLGASRPE